MREKIEPAQEQAIPIEHDEWEGMKVGDTVAVRGYDGVYRLEKILPKRGQALVYEVSGENEDSGKMFLVQLKLLTKDFA